VAGDLPEAEVKSARRGCVANPQLSLRLSLKKSNEEKHEGERTSQRRKDNYHLPQDAEPVPQAREGLPQSAASRCSSVIRRTKSRRCDGGCQAVKRVEELIRSLNSANDVIREIEAESRERSQLAEKLQADAKQAERPLQINRGRRRIYVAARVE